MGDATFSKFKGSTGGGVVWGTTGAAVDAKSIEELETKLGSKNPKATVISLANIVGADGWELVLNDRHEDTGVSMMIFKRPLR